MTDEACLIAGLWLCAFLTDELANSIIDYGLVSFEVVTTFVGLAVALGTD